MFGRYSKLKTRCFMVLSKWRLEITHLNSVEIILVACSDANEDDNVKWFSEAI